MRWAQLLVCLLNLCFACYLLAANLLFVDTIKPHVFLWSLVYLAVGSALVHLYLLYTSNKIDDWYGLDSIDSIRNISIFSSLACSSALVIYLALEYHSRQTLGYMFESPATILRNVTAPIALSIISSICLLMSTHKFKKHVTLCRSVDLEQVAPPRPNYRSAD